MASKKTQVIEWIFHNRKYDIGTDALIDPVVTMDDIAEGIRETKVKLSAANPANFWKDLTRDGATGLNRNWPQNVFEHGYAGGDAISGGERRLLMLAVSLADVGGGVEVKLGDILPGLDREVLELVLAAVAHAAGSHEHSGILTNADGSQSLDRLASLYPWPDPQ